ncbi:MAG: acetate/propionate family kinase [Planctomycetota bacterium]
MDEHWSADLLSPESSTLTINSGSSTIKFAQFHGDRALDRRLHGKIEWSGSGPAALTFASASGERARQPPSAFAQASAPATLVDWLSAQATFASVRAVGHRVVRGMDHKGPEPVTRELLDELRRLVPDDPEHLPRELALIEAFADRHPDLPQVVCFDTTFHRTMPHVARVLAIPRRYQALGVERYGFHGLSYAYLMQALTELGDPAASAGRVILAHLGNGASMAAVLAGQSIDTSMGFTPASGLPMGTRAGDLDPGLFPFLARTERMTAETFERMVNHESGLLGLSERSSDMRVLLSREATDERARAAIAYFCYQAKKWVGSFFAALGGLNTLVFAGGVGENAPAVRARICAGLQCLGIHLDERSNMNNDPVISAASSRVTVRVIRTDEERVIAEQTIQALRETPRSGTAS